MNRQFTALFAAFEALLVVAIGVAIPLVPLTLLWGFQYGLGIEWTAFWRASADIWLIGHGVDVTFTLDAATAATLGLPAADQPFTITIAALGFGLLTALLGVRAGRRVAETRYRVMGEIVSLATFALASFGVAFSAIHSAARPSIVQGTILPTLVFAIGMAIGVRMTRNELDDSGSSIRDWIADWPEHVRTILAGALRAGAASAAALLGIAAIMTATAITISYARIISLYEGLHGEVLGGLALTLGQLAVLPDLVVWAASWLVGPGFAIGAGSTVSPLATTLGPIPAIPVLGALPDGTSAFGFVGLLAPVVVAFLVGAVLGTRLRARVTGGSIALIALGGGIVGGVILGLLSWFVSGAAGPGRLAQVGPNPWAVAGWAALEFTLALLLGLYSTRASRVRKPR
jgi:hypothetical protein